MAVKKEAATAAYSSVLRCEYMNEIIGLQKKDLTVISLGLVLMVMIFIEFRGYSILSIESKVISHQQPTITDVPLDNLTETSQIIKKEENVTTLIAKALQKKGVVVAVPQGQSVDRMVFVNKLPLFQLGDAELTLEGHRLVRAIGATLVSLRAEGRWSVNIYGHTDAKPFMLMRGPFYSNEELSMARAVHTKKALQASCARARIYCVFNTYAKSFSQPWAIDPHASVNRRFDLEIKWIPPGN